MIRTELLQKERVNLVAMILATVLAAMPAICATAPIRT